MNYKPYPTSKTTQVRRNRKSERNAVYQHNRKLAKLARKNRRLAKQAE